MGDENAGIAPKAGSLILLLKMWLATQGRIVSIFKITAFNISPNERMALWVRQGSGASNFIPLHWAGSTIRRSACENAPAWLCALRLTWAAGLVVGWLGTFSGQVVMRQCIEEPCIDGANGGSVISLAKPLLGVG